MKLRLVAPLMFAMVGMLAFGQTQGSGASSTSAPASPGFGFTIPTVNGTLTYALSGSESFETGFGTGNVAYTTALGGDFAYFSKSEEQPFSLVYAGGYLNSSVPGTSSSSTYQSLTLSQVVILKRWIFSAADAFSYLPQSPTTGLSGIAGVGDINVAPVQPGVGPDQNILTNYGTRIGNGLNGSVSRQITSRTFIDGSASWQILRFLGNPGIDSTDTSVTVGPSYRIDARNTVDAGGYYSLITYPGGAPSFTSGSNPSFTSEGLNLEYQRMWSRTLSTTVSIGPQLTRESNSLLIPSQLSVSARLGIQYTRRFTSTTLSYSHGTNSGSGVVEGAISDSVSLGVQHPLGRNWQAAIDGSYSRSSSLSTIGGIHVDFQSIYGGLQVSRKISRPLFGYLSYTAVTQSGNDLAATQNAFNGLTHIIAIGLTYSPGAIHAGRP